jgi:hypothetical protein
LECHIHHIQNCGKPFLIPDGFLLADDKKVHWLEIVKSVNSYTGIPPLTLKINMKGDVRQRMLDALSREFIFRWDKDILERENSVGINNVG